MNEESHIMITIEGGTGSDSVPFTKVGLDEGLTADGVITVMKEDSRNSIIRMIDQWGLSQGWEVTVEVFGKNGNSTARWYQP